LIKGLHDPLAFANLPAVSTATVDQMQQDFAAWLAAVRHGETVAIVEGGQEVARLVPPMAASAAPVKAQRSMSDWLVAQDERMGRTFGGRIVADSAHVLNDLRSER
jgi:antitoxin (DNA-binding transcriptional repressor) of toxin-antitoxin stability system